MHSHGTYETRWRNAGHHWTPQNSMISWQRRLLTQYWEGKGNIHCVVQLFKKVLQNIWHCKILHQKPSRLPPIVLVISAVCLISFSSPAGATLLVHPVASDKMSWAKFRSLISDFGFRLVTASDRQLEMGCFLASYVLRCIRSCLCRWCFLLCLVACCLGSLSWTFRGETSAYPVGSPKLQIEKCAAPISVYNTLTSRLAALRASLEQCSQEHVSCSSV